LWIPCVFAFFSNDPKIIAVSLEALHNLLQFGKTFFALENGSNPIVKKIEELGMCDRLEQLQYNPIEIIYEKALKLIETFFEIDNSN